MKRLLPILLFSLAPVWTVNAAVCSSSSATVNVPDTTPTSRFSIQKDANENHLTVIDNQTGLEWAACPFGYSWDLGIGACTSSGSPGLTWTGALLQAVQANHDTYLGKQGWRVPNIKELASIVEYKCSDPAINNEVFGITDPTTFWSNTHVTGDTSYIRVVDFNTGLIYTDLRTSSHYLRLVRDVN